jgi:hypothetical protein
VTDELPTEELSIFDGLVKPLLEEGESGRPLKVPVVEGDREMMSDVLRS